MGLTSRCSYAYVKNRFFEKGALVDGEKLTCSGICRLEILTGRTLMLSPLSGGVER